MNQEIRTTLGIGLILGVFALTPETVRVYMGARSESRRAAYEYDALRRTWAAKTFLRNELLMMNERQELPELTPAQDELAKRTAQQFDRDLKQLRLSMRLAEQLNRQMGTSNATDEERRKSLEDIIKKGPNEIIEFSNEMDTAERADVAQAVAIAAEKDVGEAWWYMVASLAVHSITFFAGFRMVIRRSKASSLNSEPHQQVG